jgi:hypothetical protein
MAGDRGWRGEGARAALAEGLHQCAVVEFGDDRGLHASGLEPLQQCATVGDVLAGEQEGGAVERGWKARLQSHGQCGRREHRQRALAEQRAVAAHADISRERAVGDHQVETVHSEFGEQLGERRLAAHQAAGALDVERGFD